MKTRGDEACVDYKRCNLIDMVGIYEETRDIRVEDGKIVEIAKNIDPERYKDAKIIDAENNFVTPWNCRAPPFGNGSTRADI